ncbi:MAG: hypothetical protein R6W80_13490 [Haliea sp.]
MALIQCAECGKEISDKAPNCPGCGVPLEPKFTGKAVFSSKDPTPVMDKVAPAQVTEHSPERESTAPSKATVKDYGLALMAIPLVGILLMWFWVGEMSLIQGPSQSLGLVMLFTVLGTAIVASMEAAANGMVSDRTKGSYSPTQWFFIISLMWFIGYPAYLIKRRHVGLKRLGLAAAVLTTITVGSFFIISALIEEQRAELRQVLEPLERLQRELGNR